MKTGKVGGQESSKDALYNIAFDVCQSEVPTLEPVIEALVVEAK